jgi:hypothetical protein
MIPIVIIPTIPVVRMMVPPTRIVSSIMVTFMIFGVAISPDLVYFVLAKTWREISVVRKNPRAI